jgi:hypothetical protein
MILLTKFPYQPNVVTMMLAAEPGNIEALSKLMNKDYPDSLEWLEYVAPSFSPEKWQEFRKSKVKRPDPDKPK